MIYSILLGLLNRLGLFIIIAYLLSRNRAFKNLILKQEVSIVDKFLLSAIFGAFGILGTYMGVPVYGALANSRAVGVIIGGLLGGPLVGTLSGFIAGFHRWVIDIGGFTAFACGLSTFVEGTIAGILNRKLSKGRINWRAALLVGMALELLQMAIILLVAKPFEAAMELVRVIWFPMTTVNAMGIAIFVALVENIFMEQEKAGAYQAQLALDIAAETLPYLRQGLSEFSAYKTAKIIYQKANYDAVSITDDKKILAHVGVGEDHHRTGLAVQTEATRKVLSSGEFYVASSREDIECNHEKCPLKAAVIVPLMERDRMVGCLKLYRTRENSISSVDIRLAQGLAQLFSTQLELSRMERQAQLLARAELRALQSQINPHFLFNALNTIISICRRDPEKARALLIHLGEFFRKNLSTGKETVPLEQEIEHVKAYLAIEQARFGDRLRVVYDLEPMSGVMVPPLILQPLVENAVKHGIFPKREGGTVIIRAKKVEDGVELTVSDDGMGFDEARIGEFLNEEEPADRIGLFNVNRRLENLYGPRSRLKIMSKPMMGTVVRFFIPAGAGKGSEVDGAYGAFGG